MIFVLYQKIHTLLKYSYLAEIFEHQMWRCFVVISFHWANHTRLRQHKCTKNPKEILSWEAIWISVRNVSHFKMWIDIFFILKQLWEREYLFSKIQLLITLDCLIRNCWIQPKMMNTLLYFNYRLKNRYQIKLWFLWSQHFNTTKNDWIHFYTLITG